MHVLGIRIKRKSGKNNSELVADFAPFCLLTSGGYGRTCCDQWDVKWRLLWPVGGQRKTAVAGWKLEEGYSGVQEVRLRLLWLVRSFGRLL